MRFDDRAISRAIHRVRREFSARDEKLKLRRALIFRRQGDVEAAHLGIHVPAPFDESRLIFKIMAGLSDDAMFIGASLAQNAPIFQVNRITTADRDVSERAEKNADKQEQAWNGLYWSAQRQRGINFQRLLGWSQAVDGVGWYFSIPRDAAFGLPDRAFFEERTDEEIDKLITSGDATITTDDEGDEKPAESADLWFKRRRDTSKQDAIDGKTLFYVDVIPDGSFYWERDESSLSMGFTSELLPSALFGPDSDIAKLAARFLGDKHWAEYGIVINKTGQIVAGVGEGESRDSQSGGSSGRSGGDRFFHNSAVDTTRTMLMIHKVYTRDEIYYVISGDRDGDDGKIIWSSPHNMQEVPFWPVSYFDTGASDPADRYLPALDGAFAYTPLINSAFTFLSSVGAYRAFPRFVIETPAGDLQIDPKDGRPLVLTREQTVGLDPSEVAIIHGGTIKPLDVGDPAVMMQILNFFLQANQAVLPTDSETGAGGGGGPAWAISLRQQAAGVQYGPAIDSHREAMTDMGRFWANQLRLLDEHIFLIGAPGHRASERKRRGLIEIDTKDITTDLWVFQSSNNLQEKASLQQSGIAMRQAGAIDDLRMVEEFFEVPDALNYVLDMYAQRVVDATLLGPNEQIPPGSLLFDVAQANRGLAIEQLIAESPAFAMALAEFNVINGPNQEGTDSFNRGLGGPVAEPFGMRSPGIGASTTQPALPPLQTPTGVVQPPLAVQ